MATKKRLNTPLRCSLMSCFFWKVFPFFRGCSQHILRPDNWVVYSSFFLRVNSQVFVLFGSNLQILSLLTKTFWLQVSICIYVHIYVWVYGSKKRTLKLCPLTWEVFHLIRNYVFECVLFSSFYIVLFCFNYKIWFPQYINTDLSVGYKVRNMW